jgi:hypothetical protein
VGFLDDIKKATGVGLSHAEHYLRAFEKGVLLGPAHYGDAAGMFETAARKASEANDGALAARAQANAQLYGFLARGAPQALPHLAQALAQVPELEVIGSRTESMPTGPLLGEISARLVETELSQIPAGDPLRLAATHDRAAASFQTLFGTPLVTYRFQSADVHVDSGQARFFFHSGLAAWYRAQSKLAFDPDKAADDAGVALNAFRQCNDAGWIDQAQRCLTGARTKRTCWMCRREMQGAGVHFRTYSADVTPYVVERARAVGEDASGVDVTSAIVILCTPCGSAIERQADLFAARRAEAVREEMNARVRELASAIVELNARVTRLSIVGR